METEASVSAYYTIKISQHYANGDVLYIMIFGPHLLIMYIAMKEKEKGRK